jgi:hypothetical protein
MPLEYAKTHQCVKCGCTYILARMKVARRIDDVLGINEQSWVCIDERMCMRMKLERAELFQKKRLKQFKAEDAVKDPVKPPKPVKRSKKTLQFFPALDSTRSKRSRRAWAKKLRRINWGDPLNGRGPAKRATKDEP